MKNTNPNITTQHTIFIPAIPGLVEEFKGFMTMVKDYLYHQYDDVCYRPSNTKGKARHRNITIVNEKWRFFGQLIRESSPYTDTAEFYYCGRKVWEMKRTTTLLPSDSCSGESEVEDKVHFCILAVAKNCDPDIPWYGSRHFNDNHTGLHYETKCYEDKDSGRFSAEELIKDSQGVAVWAATCEGGYA